MNCQNCQKEIDNDSKFCEFCGNKIKTDKGYSELIKKILNEDEKVVQKNKRKEKYLYYFKNSILILSVFITITFFLEATYNLDGIGFLFAIPITILIYFTYKKIAKKFDL